MSPAYPSDPPASRTWWSLGPKHSSQNDLQPQLSHKSSRHSGLNSIAAALGFKSKKHPVLAIQDPGSPPPRPTMPTVVTKTHNRPPSKSVSSTQSQVDSLGPHTPEDPQRDNRQSLLTMSDSDPFAVVRAISSAPQSPSIPSRLALITSSSNPDIMSKNAESILNRVSYASSSSQSNTHGSDPSLSPIIDLTKKPRPNLHRKQSVMSGHGDQSLESAWESLVANQFKAGTSDQNGSSQPAAAPTPCPPMYSRGMTDPGQRLESTILTASSSSSHSPLNPSPRTVIRQLPVSRIRLPRSAPPKQELPPPPSVQDYRVRDDGPEPTSHVPTDSASSSSLSFASSISSPKDILNNQHYSPRKREKVPLENSISTSARVGSGNDTSHRRFSPSTPHTLKKAISHQSFGRRLSPLTSSVPVPLPELPSPPKAPRKQRSFHHARFPLPPLSPKRSSTFSGSQTSTAMTDSQPNTEQRRGSAGGFSLPVRKRLFSSGSNSRRPSTSQSIVPEDDSQSVFSVRSVPDQSIGTTIFKPPGQPLSPHPNSSFWDEVSLPDQMPSSPSTHEYTPQQIMSPAEIAKLEASVDDLSTSDASNRRGFSVLSTSTTTSIVSDGGPGTSVVESSSSADAMSIHSVANKNKPITRSASLVQKGLSAPPRPGVRPSTSQLSVKTSTVSERSSPISSPPSPLMTSLPPPPRRGRSRVAFVNDNFSPQSLPPPPSRRPKISVENTLHRRSIMRKPSFLEIDDDSDKDTDIESLGEPPSGSFLDLARESFDITSE
ncbi:hypothetical protein E4T56_gene3994 [Termitomyces sp. T112]|nr:hypothetical protein E4T56_gene3994 [Termitomyces sp. T112]